MGASCGLCGVDRVTDDMFCFGCMEHICDECSLNDALFGSHDSIDHLESFEEEELDMELDYDE